MRARYLAFSTAALMVMAATELAARARADDTAPAAPAATTTAPAAAPDAPPVNVPRPSIVPKTADKGAEPQAPQTTDETPPRRHRPHYAHRHHWRYAYWEPFPIYWPRFYRNHVYWNRIRWFSF